MKNLLLFVILFLGAAAHSDSKTFSEAAWKRIEPLYQKIRKHPFNVELLQGTLSNKRFDYYSSQDSFYLDVYSKAFAILGTKLEEPKDIQMAFKVSSDCLKEKSEKNPRTI